MSKGSQIIVSALTNSITEMEIELNDDFEVPVIPQEPTIEERVLSLESSSLEVIATTFDIDFRLCEVEWALEDAVGVQAVNLAKSFKGGNVMALSRYEQAKIMILGGAYVRETLERQLTTYLKRGYLTKEEYDELIALMDARELVTEEEK